MCSTRSRAFGVAHRASKSIRNASGSAQPVDAEQFLILDEGKYQAPASVLVAQALHHGNAHREQVCSILTGLGIEPPDVQAWAWADATGRGRERKPDG